MENNICTEQDSYEEGLPGRWQHPDAKEIRQFDKNYSSYVDYECPHCKLKFTCELPD